MVIALTRRALSAFLALGLASLAAKAATPDEAAIVTLMVKSFDRPDAGLEVEPVVVAGDHAVAGWSQGPLAGRALLRREHGGWRIVLCAGDAIRSADGLKHVGVPARAAASLATRLAEAEQSVAPERLRAFAGFGETVFMDGGAHPPAAHRQP